MKIKYYPVENLISSESGSYRAQVSGYVGISEKEIIEYITRSGSTITPAEAKANYEELIGAYEYFLKQGCGINTEFINIRPTIQGVFHSEEDKFDNSRHKVRFRVVLGKRYNGTSGHVSVEKTERTNNAPLPVQVEDIASETVNNILTPGGTVVLSGARLLFRPDDEKQGIFLLAAGEPVMRMERILSAKGSQVVFVVPAGTPAGEYSLEVRTGRTTGGKVKTGILTERLTV